MQGVELLITVAAVMGGILLSISALAYMYSMRSIKNKTVGDGQHGTARWATKSEIKNTYLHVPFDPKAWRYNPDTRPEEQGIVVGCKDGKNNSTIAMVSLRL